MANRQVLDAEAAPCIVHRLSNKEENGITLQRPDGIAK